MQLTLDSCKNGGPPPLPFLGGEERSLPNPKMGGEERGLLLPSRFQQGEYGHNFFRENLLKKNEVQRRKIYGKWCQNDQEDLQYDQEFLKRGENLMC